MLPLGFETNPPQSNHLTTMPPATSWPMSRFAQPIRERRSCFPRLHLVWPWWPP